MRAREELAGKRVRCPSCSRLLTVPIAEVVEEVLPVLSATEPDDFIPSVLPAEEEPPSVIAVRPPGPARPVTAFRLWWYYALNSYLPLAILLTLTSPGFLIIMLAVRGEDQRYAREGVAGEATVLSKSRLPTKSGWTNTVRYRFAARDGRTVEASGTIPDGRWALLNEGDRIPIQYLASDPGQSRPAYVGEGERDILGMIGIGSAVGLMAFALLLLFFCWRGIARRIRLLRRGTPTLAEIVDVHQQFGVLHYRYRDAAGREHKDRMSRNSQTRTLQRGDTLRLVYDPSRPARHEVDVLGVRCT
jgi:hypothetical protein